MKIEITREKLQELRELSGEMEELRGLIRSFRYGLDGRAGDGSPRGTEVSDPTAKKAVRKTSLEKKWETAIAEIDTIGSEFEDAIKVLDTPSRRIMRMYYLQNMNDRRIGSMMGYAREVVCRKRSKSIDILTRRDRIDQRKNESRH